MNNERYNHIIDDAYEKYKSNTPEQHVVGSDSDIVRHSMIYKNKLCHLSGYPIFERLSQEEFISKCKTDSEFSERWGLKIEERELSFIERLKISGIEIDNQMSFVDYTSILNAHNIPTKLITITYNNEKTEIYE